MPTPPAAPTNVTATGNDGRAIIQWSATESDIAGFIVRTNTGTSVVTGPNERSVTVTGVQSATVRAFNAGGVSEPSASAIVRLPALHRRAALR